MKVYLVEFGEYSDRYIAAAYKNKDFATAHARSGDGGVMEVEVSTKLEERAQRFYRPNECLYVVRMGIDGDKSEVYEEFWQEPKVWLSASKSHGIVIGHCWAKDEKHAIKIVSDRRTMWNAAGQPLGKESNYGWAEVPEMV